MIDTQKLRQRILDLAIRGKLVPQDPNDEPASVLLEKIRAEKERLIKEGKIKRPKAKKPSDKSHYEDFQPPFDIPDSWDWVTLEDICELLSGRDLENNQCNSENKGIPYLIGASNIVDGKFKFIRWTDAPQVISTTGDVLISCKGTIGELLLNDFGDIHIARQFMAIRSSVRHIDSRFLLIALEWSLDSIKEQANGIIPGISRPVLLELYLPIPPIVEQKRIVNEVNRYTDYLKSVDGNIATLKTSIIKIKSAILDLAMQGKLVEQDSSDEPAADMLRRVNPKAKIITDNPHYPQLPDNWVLTTIKDAFEINPKNKVQDDTISGFVPMASIMDGFNNSFKFENRNWSQIKSGFTHFADGDVAVAKISPCLENRKSMILKGLPNGIGAGTTELLVFRSNLLLPEFSLLFFKSNYFINCCVGTFNGVVGQQRVGKNIVEDIVIPIPPRNLQQKIIYRVNDWFRFLDGILNSI